MANNLSNTTKSSEASRQRRFAIFVASLGNLIGWFDFYVYSFASIYFAPVFFPPGDSTAQLFKAASVFAVGFLARPIGGWLFGGLADKKGRRFSMVLSVLTTCTGSLIIACLPSYASIGPAAPALLIFARLLQGLSVGGAYGTSATYMSEIATRGRRGFFASFQSVTLIGGQLLALLTIQLLEHFLPAIHLRAWGWRIPFVLGAIGSLTSLWIRSALPETTSKAVQHQKAAGSLQHLFKHKTAFFTVLGFTAAGSLSFYTFTVYMQKYLVNTTGLDSKTANLIMISGLFIYMVSQPLFGALSDRIGRRSFLVMFSGLMAVSTVPILYTLSVISNPYIVFMLVLISLMILSLYTSIGGVVKAELFPVEIRSLGVGFSHAIANAAFGGTAESIALLLKAYGHESSFYWYITAISIVSLFVSLRMPQLNEDSALDTDKKTGAVKQKVR